jgi:hypothetical protein
MWKKTKKSRKKSRKNFFLLNKCTIFVYHKIRKEETMETLKVNIDILEFINSLFEKIEKPDSINKEWDECTYLEKIEDFKYHIAKYKRMWFGFDILSKISKAILLGSPAFIFLSSVGISFATAIITIATTAIISFILYKYFAKLSNDGRIMVRAFEYSMENDMI